MTSKATKSAYTADSLANVVSFNDMAWVLITLRVVGGEKGQKQTWRWIGFLNARFVDSQKGQRNDK